MPRLIAVAALGVVVGGARIARRSATKEVSGVPMINYEFRHAQYNGYSAQQSAGVYEWVAKFKSSAQESDMSTFCGGNCIWQGHASGIPMVTLRGTELELLKMVQGKESQIEFLEPDVPVFAEPVSDLGQSDNGQWNLDTIGVPNARYTGQGVNVYVMDTGVNTEHMDFQGRAIPTIDTIRGYGSVVECDPADSTCAKDDNAHGTHVAGTVAGRTYGVAKQATIRAMKVCCGSGSNINGGMDWLVRNHIKPAVMTMSLGSYRTPESSRIAVDAVVAAGVTVTVSAGNRGTDSCLKSFTFIATAIGVGSIDAGSSRSRSSFSNWGSCNAIYAPGRDIKSASHLNNFGSRTMSGTSMAAPAVAGATALLLEANPTYESAKIRSVLRGMALAGELTNLKQGDPNLLLQVESKVAGGVSDNCIDNDTLAYQAFKGTCVQLAPLCNNRDVADFCCGTCRDIAV